MHVALALSNTCQTSEHSLRPEVVSDGASPASGLQFFAQRAQRDAIIATATSCSVLHVHTPGSDVYLACIALVVVDCPDVRCRFRNGLRSCIRGADDRARCNCVSESALLAMVVAAVDGPRAFLARNADSARPQVMMRGRQPTAAPARDSEPK